MNFESPKKSSLESKSGNNKEKINFSETIKDIYKDGRRVIMFYFITLGLLNPEQSTDTTKEDLISIRSYFNKVDSSQSIQITKDWDELFNMDELHSMVSLYDQDFLVEGDSTQIKYYKFILNPENRKKLIEIDREFEISPQDLRSISDPINTGQVVITSPDFNTKILPKIKELRKLFPQEDNPPARFIDINNQFKCLSNPDYPKALEYVLDKTYNPSHSDYAHPASDILEIYNDPYFKKLIGILDDRGIYFNETIVLCDDKKNQEKFLHFLNDPKNEKILNLFSKQSPIGGYEMQTIVNTDYFEKHWRPILEKDNTRKKMNILEEYGFTVRSLFIMQENNIDKLLHDNEYLKGLTFLLEHNSASGSVENTIGVMESILSYYTDNKVDLSQLESDFNSLTSEFISSRKLSGLNEKLRLKKWETFKPVISRVTQEEDVNINQFAEDPALQYIVGQMDLFKKIPSCLSKFNPEQQKEWILRIARNMYISRIDPTMANFERVFNETISVRNNPELLEQSLFKNRNVLVFGHNEIWAESITKKEDKVRFANEVTLDAIESQGVQDLRLIKSLLNTQEDLEQKKTEFFQYIADHNELTIIISAHGSPDGIFLTDGVPDENGKISRTGKEEYVSPNEFVAALELRYDNNFKDTPILIFESCYNQNYIRNLYRLIDEINSTKNKMIPYPIMCGTAEFGQVGYGSPDSKYQDFFSQAILEGKKDTKIKDLIEVEAGAREKGIYTNISLFVPVPEIAKEKKEANKESIVKKKYYQIAEVDENKIQQSHIQQYAKSVLDGSLDNQTASYFEQVQPKTAKSIRELLDKKEAGLANENIS